MGVVRPQRRRQEHLLRTLTRRQDLDSGRVTHSRGLRVGYLEQADLPPGRHRHREHARPAAAGRAGRTRGRATRPSPQRALRPAVRHRGRRARRVQRTGLGAVRRAAAPGGAGHRAARRARPARARRARRPPRRRGRRLARRATCATRWPAGRGALLVVTHDRWFLDAVCTTTWEVHDGVVDRLRRRLRRLRAGPGPSAPRVAARSPTSGAPTCPSRGGAAWLRRGAPARTSKPRFRMDAAAALVARRAAHARLGEAGRDRLRPGSART